MYNCGLKHVKIYSDSKTNRLQYAPPKSYKAGDEITEQACLIKDDLRSVLTRDHSNLNCEVWMLPLAVSNDQALVSMSKHATVKQLKEQGIELKATACIFDLDDTEAHAQGRPSTQDFFTSLEIVLEPYKSLHGYFYYRTLRGARVGFIYENPQDLDDNYFVKRELFHHIQRTVEDLHTVEVDETCLQDERGFTVPHGHKLQKSINQVITITPDHARLFINDHSLSNEQFQSLLDSYKNNPKMKPKTMKTDHYEAPKNSNRGRNNERDTSKKTGVYCPSNIDHLDNTEQYQLSRSLIYKISNFIHHRELRLDILKAIDAHIMEGRRAQKEPSWFEREIESLDSMIPCKDDAVQFEELPEPAHIDEFKELNPLRRIFERGDDLELAECVIESFCIEDQPAPLWHGHGLRKYEPTTGIWKFYGDKALKRIAMKSKGAMIQGEKKMTAFKVNNAKVKASVDMIASLQGSDNNHTVFDTAPCGVVLNDKFITSTTDGLQVKNISPAWFAIHKLDIDLEQSTLDYWMNRGGTAPTRPHVFCHDFLTRSLTRELADHETQADLDKEIDIKITCILEWLGLALLGLCTREAVALVVHGEGSNGKSVLTKFVADLFGKDQTSHLPPQNMSERFSRAQLFGALINVVSEMPEHELISSDTIKAVISGDEIEVERKHKDPFSFTPRAGHLFSCNNLPPSRDRSHGLWRRFLPIKFEHIFTEKDKDPFIIDKLREEKDQIVLYALEKARLYLARGGFEHIAQINLWRWDWRGSTDQIASFFNDCCEIVQNTKEYTATKSVYDAFKTWAEDNGGGSKMSKIKFSKSFRSLPNVQKKNVRLSGGRVQSFNVKLTNTTTSTNDAWK